MTLGRAIFAAGLIGLSAAGMALADDVTFTVNGSFNDGASLGGTLVIDTGKGFVESNGLDLTVMGGDAGTPGLVFDTLTGSGVFFDGVDNLAYIDAADSSDGGPSLQLEINIGKTDTLAGFTGGTFCYVPATFPDGYPEEDNCGAYFSNYQLFSESERPGDPQLIGGSTAPAPSGAPEPASLLLLAGPAALLVRRQLRKS
jgi:hypothetical protein